MSHPSWHRLVATAILVLCLWPAAAARAAGTASGATIDAQRTGAGSVTFDGYVVTGTGATSWYFAYAPQSSTFCTSYGDSGTAAETATQTATSDGPVSASVSALTPGVAYCYALMVSQGGTPVSGGVEQVTVGLPTAWTQLAEATGGDTATVSGEVDAGGQPTTYEAGYDTADSAWCLSAGAVGSPGETSPAQSLDPSVTGEQPVAVELSGLTPGTEYCAALIARNGTGTATGTAVEFLAGVPHVVLSSTPEAADTTVTIAGAVDPAGQATSYAVEYDPAGSDWCQTEGFDGVPELTTAGSLPAAEGATGVQVTLTGLTPGTQYCAELIAINQAATVRTVMTNFTTTGTAPTTGTTTPTAPPTTPTTKPSGPPATAPTTTRTPPARTAPTAPPARTAPTTTATTPVSPPSSGPPGPARPPATEPGGRTVRAPLYAVALAGARHARAVTVRIRKARAVRLRITSHRARTMHLTVTLSARRRRTGPTVRVAIRAHTTRTIVVRFPPALRRALRGRRTVRLTVTGR